MELYLILAGLSWASGSSSNSSSSKSSSSSSSISSRAILIPWHSYISTAMLRYSDFKSCVGPCLEPMPLFHFARKSKAIPKGMIVKSEFADLSCTSINRFYLSEILSIECLSLIVNPVSLKIPVALSLDWSSRASNDKSLVTLAYPVGFIPYCSIYW